MRSLSVSNIVLCALFANYAIYLKEPTFIFFGVLSVMILFLRRSRGLDSLNVLGIVLLISSVVFITLYMVMVYPYITNAYNESRFKHEGEYRLTIMVKKLLDNLLQNNFVFLGILTTVSAHIFARQNTHMFRNDKHIVMVSMATASIMVVLGFVAAKAVSSSYYLSTSYFYFAMPVAAYFNINRFNRFLAKAAGVICIIGPIPYAVHTLTVQKSYPVAYFDTVEYLREYIRERKNEHVSIFFDGYSREPNQAGVTGRWVHFLDEDNYAVYINPKDDIYRDSNQLSLGGIIQEDSTWQSSPPSTRKEERDIKLARVTSKMPYFNSLDSRDPRKGDLIIYDYYSHTTDVERLKQKYELIFESRYIGIPNIGLRSIILRGIQVMSPSTYGSFGANPNVFRLPMAIYVFRA